MISSVLRLDATRQVSLPHSLPPVTARGPRQWELILDSPVISTDHGFALFVYLWVEGRAVIHEDRLFDNKVLVLELLPILVEQLEAPLDCSDVLQRQAELKVVLHEEPDLMRPVNRELALRQRSVA